MNSEFEYKYILPKQILLNFDLSSKEFKKNVQTDNVNQMLNEKCCRISFQSKLELYQNNYKLIIIIQIPVPPNLYKLCRIKAKIGSNIYQIIQIGKPQIWMSLFFVFEDQQSEIIIVSLVFISICLALILQLTKFRECAKQKTLYEKCYIKQSLQEFEQNKSQLTKYHMEKLQENPRFKEWQQSSKKS